MNLNGRMDRVRRLGCDIAGDSFCLERVPEDAGVADEQVRRAIEVIALSVGYMDGDALCDAVWELVKEARNGVHERAD